MGDTDAAFFISMTILAAGIGSILQSLKGHYLGSGYLCPSMATLVFVQPSAAAYAIGGLGLMSAMTAVSGVFQVAISRIVSRLRFLFPPEVTGLVIIMAVISAIPFAIQNFLAGIILVIMAIFPPVSYFFSPCRFLSSVRCSSTPSVTW